MPRATEDRDEILQLLYRYNHAIDVTDVDGWVGCFTEDAVLDLEGTVTAGRGALRELAGEVGGRGVRHVVLNPLIDVTGDTAHGRAYLVMLRAAAVVASGAYVDDYVRTPGGWRIAHRAVTFDARAADAGE